MIGNKGAFHLYEYRTGRRYGEGQVDANAWTALGLLEGYRVAPTKGHLEAAEQVLRFAVHELFDASRGAFSEDKSSPPLLDANGLLAQALFTTQVGGRTEHLDGARRHLATVRRL